jgi:hypothetical protein
MAERHNFSHSFPKKLSAEFFRAFFFSNYTGRYDWVSFPRSSKKITKSIKNDTISGLEIRQDKNDSGTKRRGSHS